MNIPDSHTQPLRWEALEVLLCTFSVHLCGSKHLAALVGQDIHYHQNGGEDYDENRPVCDPCNPTQNNASFHKKVLVLTM